MHFLRTPQFSLRRLFVAVLIALLCVATAQAERIPRILYVGDSWTGFMWGFRSMRTALDSPDYEADGFSRWIETGTRTAIMGAKTFEFLSDSRKAAVEDEIRINPNVDVVLMTLGGNDYSGGFPIDAFGGQEKDWYNWFDDNRNGIIWDVNILFDQLRDDLRQVMQHILDQRPDIRIVMVGYDYTTRNTWDHTGLTIAYQNQSLVEMERMKKDLCLEAAFNGRAIYVQSFGLIQNSYGYFKANEWGDSWHAGKNADPPDPYPPAWERSLSNPLYVAPGNVPDPGQWNSSTPYEPFPGGDILWQDPRAAYIDEDIHLQKEGYDLSAKHALDVIIKELLNYPKVLSIIPNAKKSDSQAYEVTFTHPVTGVDRTDFEIFVGPEKGMKAMEITNVESVADGEKYLVTANMDGASGNLLIRVLDDGTIFRADEPAIALGGPGLGNGLFEFNGTYDFQDLLRPADDDFIGALNYLDIAFKPYLDTFAPGLSLAPDRLDVNGDFINDGFSIDPISIPGNTMLDSYEFSLIKYCLDHPNLDLSSTGGIKASDVVTAWNKNIKEMQRTLGGNGAIADTLLPGLDTMFAGYMTLGDADSVFFTSTLLSLLNDVDNFPTDVKPLVVQFYTGFPFLLGRGWKEMYDHDNNPVTPKIERFVPCDADGDGYTNEEEYAYFYPEGPEAYAEGALNPKLFPKVPVGAFEKGVNIRLAMTEHPAWEGTFQWKRNGIDVVDGNGISGSQRRCLSFTPISTADAGSYTCVYQVPAGSGKARILEDRIFGPIKLDVVEMLPVAGLSGLLSLAMAAAISGVAALRKRR